MLITYSPRIQKPGSFRVRAAANKFFPQAAQVLNFGAAVFNTSRFFNKDRRAEILPKVHNPNHNGIHTCTALYTTSLSISKEQIKAKFHAGTGTSGCHK